MRFRGKKGTIKLAELLKCNLRTVRAYLLREDFQRFWDYRLPACVGRFVTEWCSRVMRSRIKPMKRVAKMLRRHHELILNWFRAKGTISSGVVVGFSDGSGHQNRLVPSTWSLAGAGIHPQVLVRRQKKQAVARGRGVFFTGANCLLCWPKNGRFDGRRPATVFQNLCGVREWAYAFDEPTTYPLGGLFLRHSAIACPPW